MIKNIINNYDIDISKSFMIGDKLSDEICAIKSKIYFEYPKKNSINKSEKLLRKNNMKYKKILITGVQDILDLC